MTALILSLLYALLLVPAAVLFVEVAAATIPGGRAAVLSPGGRPRRIAILIPAHDEETTIARTLRSVAPQLEPGDRLLVVADNCSDQTAEIARSEGAEVITRQNRELRGKGYALDYGVRHLESDSPDVVIIIDADCLVEPGTVATLAATAAASARPVQALYRMRAPEGAALRMRIAEFAWLVKNQVSAHGYRHGVSMGLHSGGAAGDRPHRRGSQARNRAGARRPPAALLHRSHGQQRIPDVR
jgi:glycosyltransferase involved in cell wall biosynthesis